jgi:hypothetical protein
MAVSLKPGGFTETYPASRSEAVMANRGLQPTEFSDQRAGVA